MMADIILVLWKKLLGYKNNMYLLGFSWVLKVPDWNIYNVTLTIKSFVQSLIWGQKVGRDVVTWLLIEILYYYLVHCIKFNLWHLSFISEILVFYFYVSSYLYSLKSIWIKNKFGEISHVLYIARAKMLIFYVQSLSASAQVSREFLGARTGVFTIWALTLSYINTVFPKYLRIIIL